MWWGLCDMAAGDVEGTHIVVVVGDMGMWLLCFIVRRLSWLVGGQGCSWWWVLQVGDVVAGRWWLWDEEGICVTICDNVTSESTF